MKIQINMFGMIRILMILSFKTFLHYKTNPHTQLGILIVQRHFNLPTPGRLKGDLIQPVQKDTTDL